MTVRFGIDDIELFATKVIEWIVGGVTRRWTCWNVLMRVNNSSDTDDYSITATHSSTTGARKLR